MISGVAALLNFMNKQDNINNEPLDMILIKTNEN